MLDRLGQCGTYSAELSGPDGELRTRHRRDHQWCV